MKDVVYLFVILLYSIAFFVLGWYIKLVEIFDTVAYKGTLESASYDYIVVGCGSAGSVVASRLAENKNHSILVLEAGARGGRLMDIPVVFPFLHKSSVDWQFKVVSQKYAAKAYNDNRISWPMGRIVGGSSRINNMIYSRGHTSDYKEWFKDKEAYDYNIDILEYFKKSENQRGAYKNDTRFHSQSGLNIIEDISFITPLFNAFSQAVQALGFPIRDINGQHNTGFMQPQATTKSQSRWTASDYLEEQNNSNLILLTNSLVHKVLLKSNYEAYAVKYFYFGQEMTVRARKGVILCAGAVGTPKVLMLSGIGLKEHLNTIGINTKVNLPVGNNLRDHVTTGFDLVLLNSTLGINLGVWTTIGCEILGSINTASSCYRKFENETSRGLRDCFDHDTSQPDLGFMALPIGLGIDSGQHLYKSLGLCDTVWDEYFKPIARMPTATILPIVLHPKSKGTVRLKSKDPYQEPLINPNYLEHPYDVSILLKGINLIKRIISTKSMQDLGARLNDRVFPGCEGYSFDSKPYWECYVRHLTLTSYHYAGTCKMGRSDTSVVGHDFKVHNTNKLFVVDASVLPSLPSGNPNAVVMMLAEKAADEIKQIDYLSRKVCYLQELFYLNTMCYL